MTSFKSAAHASVLLAMLVVLLTDSTVNAYKPTVLVMDVKVAYFNNTGASGPGQLQTFVDTYVRVKGPGRNATGLRLGTCIETTYNAVPALWTCQITYQFPEGNVMLAGIMSQQMPYWNATTAVVGGTGKYKTAKGESHFQLYVPTHTCTETIRIITKP